jgi:poly(3-hydroxybutyrate) depolymerase
MLRSGPGPCDRRCGKRSQIPDEAYRSLGIASVASLKGACAVGETRLATLRFGVLRGFCKRSAGERRALIAAPLAGAYPFLLRDLVVALLSGVDEVAITDWPDARYVPASLGVFGLADNILHIEEMIRRLGPPLHVVAVCQAVVPALAATALLAARDDGVAPLSLTLIGGAVDPLANPSHVVRLLRRHSLAWFRDNVIDRVADAYPGRSRRVYSRNRQLETLTAYALRHMVDRRELFWKLLVDDGDDPIRFPFASLCWSLMDIPAELLLDTVREVFHRTSIARGELSIDGRHVDLRAVEHTALATIEGEDDDISSVGQTSAAHVLCPAVPDRMRLRLVVKGSGHFSLFHGGIARETVAPAILSLIERAQRGERSALGRRRVPHAC